MLFVRSSMNASGGLSAVTTGTVTGTNWAQGYVAQTPLVSTSAISSAYEASAGFFYTTGRALAVRDCSAGVVAGTRNYNGVLQDTTGLACYINSANGDSGLYLNGVATNYASSPDSVPLSITAVIDIAARVAATDWTPAASSMVVTKALDTGDQRSFMFYIGTDGTLRFQRTPDGVPANNVDAGSTVATGFTDGSMKWIRTTFVAASGDVNFYTASDSVSVPTAWTQLGTTVSTTASAIQDGTALLNIGARDAGATQPLAGKVARVVIAASVGGTAVFDANFAAQTEGATTFSESSSNAAVVTVNGTSAKIVRPYMSSGMAVCGDGRFFMAVT